MLRSTEPGGGTLDLVMKGGGGEGALILQYYLTQHVDAHIYTHHRYTGVDSTGRTPSAEEEAMGKGGLSCAYPSAQSRLRRAKALLLCKSQAKQHCNAGAARILQAPHLRSGSQAQRI